MKGEMDRIGTHLNHMIGYSQKITKNQKNMHKEKKATIYSHKSAKTYLSELSTVMCSQENKNKEL